MKLVSRLLLMNMFDSLINQVINLQASAHFGAGKGPIFIDDLNCQDDSKHLNNCTYETYDNCNHDDDIAVVCTGLYDYVHFEYTRCKWIYSFCFVNNLFVLFLCFTLISTHLSEFLGGQFINLFSNKQFI
jgi:hypothetical protein